MNAKEAAGRAAAELVEAGMRVGLGTGSTAYFFLKALGERVARGLRIQGLPTSRQTETLAREWHIPLIAPDFGGRLDLVVDGADEFDPQLALIKGGGGALYREKLVASLTQRLVIVADAAKAVPVLGAFPLPVEVVPFGWELTRGRIAALGCKAQRREQQGQPFLTDNGNYILDCHFGQIPQPDDLHHRLKSMIGVVETGLFTNMAVQVIVGSDDGTVQHRHKSHG
ncbi:MAG: ribose 5-phosphate isomerase A [Bacteroidia bacterium]